MNFLYDENLDILTLLSESYNPSIVILRKELKASK